MMGLCGSNAEYASNLHKVFAIELVTSVSGGSCLMMGNWGYMYLVQILKMLWIFINSWTSSTKIGCIDIMNLEASPKIMQLITSFKKKILFSSFRKVDAHIYI